MIPIHNIYYMLAYAFRVLNKKGYRGIETEEFQNVAELCTAILTKGLSRQLKRGLGKEYICETEALSSPRGKIDVTASIKDLNMVKTQLVCIYDEFSVNSYMNSIIKSTLELLLKSKISPSRKKEIKKQLVFFGEVDTIDVHTINWSLRFNRNNQDYKMLISVCHLVIKGLLQTNPDGSAKLRDFLDDQQMHHLYEKFILEYYNTEYRYLKVKAAASMMDWQVDDGFRDLLPKMKTDITLTCGERTLIIDAKYYERNLREQFGKVSIPTGNLYQIFTYVKTKENELVEVPHKKVAGMLLYAQTEEDGEFNNEYQMMENPICVRTLDLSGNFQKIRDQLDEIAEHYLGVKLALGARV
ncbi:5-methylcytosine-specific restriction enzyme subunit McrC [Eubacterium ruminantium]|nr:5-methylcytosine-specific restriction enzyme subunit McrC [Eubacterium ruminantium]